LEYYRLSGGAGVARGAERSLLGASWSHLFSSCTETITSLYWGCGAMCLLQKESTVEAHRLK